MPKEYTLPDGKKIRKGPFKIDGYSFPENWFDIVSASGLAHWGITSEDVIDPPPPPPPKPPTVPEQAAALLAQTKDTVIEFLESNGSVPPAWQSYRLELHKAERGARPDLPPPPA